MRIFPLTSKNINAQQSHFRFLNQQCNALIQYQDQFNPEYKILNDQYIYYTYEELVEKKIIKPVKQNDHPAIVVLVENLKYGEGLINNFTTNYVYVYFGNPSDWDALDEIPESWLPDEATDLIFADLYMREPEGKDNCIFQYWTIAEDAPLSLFKDSTEIPKLQKTGSLESTYPKLTIISFNNTKNETATVSVVETQQVPKLHLLPSSYYVVSQYSLETPINKNENGEVIINHSNKKDYLITRLARGGGYYTFFYFWDDEEQKTYAKVTYVPEATDELGLTYLIDADPRQKRFIATGAYDQYDGVKSASYPSFILDENNEVVIQITTSANGLWTGNNLINHEFLLPQIADNNKTHYETLFLDDTRERTSVNLHNTAAPAYKVEISQELPFTPLYNIW